MSQKCNEKYDLKTADKSNGKKAFTIVEVLVALTVLGTSAIAILGTLRMCSSAAHHSRMLTDAVLLAESKLADIKVSDNTEFGTKQGTENSFKWQVQLVFTEIEGMAVVKVAVTWYEQRRKQQYELISLIRMKSFIGK